MKFLIVEDEFTSRQLMQIYLADFGQAFIAVNGREAVAAFVTALNEGHPYDMICLDIMMPEMDGQQALKAIREIEKQRGIGGLDAVKVIMTTAKDSPSDILGSFKTGCEAYIIKPVRKEALIKEMQKLGMLSAVTNER
jgi:two-component system, chemotaxis family, chemotaxis protein CheY